MQTAFRLYTADDVAYFPVRDWQNRGPIWIRQDDFETIVITPQSVSVIHEPDGGTSVVDVTYPNGVVERVGFEDWKG